VSNILYNSAYDLKKALEQSKEYIQLKKLYDDVQHDESAKNIFHNFRSTQLNLHEKQVTGIEITEEEIIHAEKCVQLVQQNGKIAALLKAEESMNMLLQRITSIILEPLDELYKKSE